ncbi:uncharacterized protein LOC142177113 [Nicotiana tabacum]|uniref:Uncharacterized protein LOC142177113 n=1 Tax=Nicotiana tabacum TaxID=4097 RepID=A0AC58TWU6_TOBAC
MAREAVEFFQAQFTEERIPTNFDIIQRVPRMMSQDQNARLWEEPTMEGVKASIFGLNGDSASGPDGFTGQFYQARWEVVCDDVLNMVRAFFCGAELPNFITHTNLILLSKKKNVAIFSDIRAISLRNFSNKIISRVIHESFVKGRSIVENILLTQDIIKDIRLRGKPSNIVIKLDMEKAYDRVSWLFIIKVLRKMGFAAEVLGRALDALFDNPDFIGFGMPKWSQNINYLSCVDNTIIFYYSHYGAVHLIMNVLEEYEAVSGFTGAIQAMEGQAIGRHGKTYVFLKVREVWISDPYMICLRLCLPNFGGRLQMRDEVEHQVWWQLKNGNSYFWYDNWTGLGALYHASGPDHWNPKEETLPHVFLTSPVARYVMNYYSAPVGIRTYGKQLVQVINEWWSKPVNTCLKAVYQAMPSLIVWHLWKKRNSGKHGKSVSINRLIFQISTSIQMLLKVRRPGFKGVTANWPDLHEKLSQHIPKLICTKVMWELPPVGWIKCNTDGAYRGVNGGVSYGLCIRDGIGYIIYAQADANEDATNNVAEAHAILEALRYITQMQCPSCITETDSLRMKRVLDEVWEPPWSIANQIDEIKTLLSKGDFKIFHVLREGNKLADHLVNLTLDQQHIVHVLSFWELDTQGRRILNNVKLQIPYIRVKTAKPNAN